ncbi:MAG: hypothetical protein ABSA46_05565 [Thermodesulfovibrionales bacterium]|jgi:hypothetical protein
MRRYDEDPARFNPVKLADNFVIALSLIKKGYMANIKQLEEGDELCDYFMDLLEDLEHGGQLNQLTSPGAIKDREVLSESGVTREKVSRMKSMISRLIAERSAYTKRQIEEIQAFFIAVTMPMWQNRISEFREKRLKRGHIVSV